MQKQDYSKYSINILTFLKISFDTLNFIKYFDEQVIKLLLKNYV